MRPILMVMAMLAVCPLAFAQEDVPEIFREPAPAAAGEFEVGAVGDSSSDAEVREGLRYLYQRLQDLEDTAITKAEATKIIKAEVKAEVERVRVSFRTAAGKVESSDVEVTVAGQPGTFRIPQGATITSINGVSISQQRSAQLGNGYGAGTYAGTATHEVVYAQDPRRPGSLIGNLRRRAAPRSQRQWSQAFPAQGVTTCANGSCN